MIKLLCSITRPRRSSMCPRATFSFFLFFKNFHFFILLALSSSSHLPPRPSFLLVAPSSLSVLPPLPSFLLVVKIHFSPYLTKAWPTNQRTNGRTRPQSHASPLLFEDALFAFPDFFDVAVGWLLRVAQFIHFRGVQTEVPLRRFRSHYLTDFLSLEYQLIDSLIDWSVESHLLT